MAFTTTTLATEQKLSLKGSFEQKHSSTSGKKPYEWSPLWTGPSVITAVCTGKSVPWQSLMNANHSETSAIQKINRTEPVFLSYHGFRGDQQTYPKHQTDDRTVLQYYSGHYSSWKEELKDVMTKDEQKRSVLLCPGGFGENLSARDPPHGPPMEERTVCIGDLVGIRRPGNENDKMVKIRVTGPRQPCYKLNHRFGIADMSLRAKNRSATGWLYRTVEEGDIQIGDEMVLLDRPYPEWPVARIQHFLYTDPKDYNIAKKMLKTLRKELLVDVQQVFEARLRKCAEDINLRLEGTSTKDTFAQYRLSERHEKTKRISEFVFDRVSPIPENSSELKVAPPGSHIRLKFNVQNGHHVQLLRPYSIISGNSNRFRLGIALSDKSRGGSSFLHQILRVDDVVEASDNIATTFPLARDDEADHHVFLAGGIGITAFLNHIKYCIESDKSFHLHYLVRNKSDAAFLSDVESMMTKPSDSNSTKQNGEPNEIMTPAAPIQRFTIYNSASGDRCDVSSLLSTLATQAKTHIYTCGSERLSDAVTQAAQRHSIPQSRLHFEQFSVDASGDPFVAELVRSKKIVQVAGKQSLLEALREAGMEVASSCEAGNCGTCRVRVKCGMVEHKGTGLLNDEKAGMAVEGEAGEMLACVSRGIGRIEIEL